MSGVGESGCRGFEHCVALCVAGGYDAFSEDCELYFSTVKMLVERPTHISSVATVLLISKTFTVKYYDRRL